MVRYIVGLARHLPAFGFRVTFFHRASEPLNPAHVAGLDCDVVGLRDCSGLFWEQVSVPVALARGSYHLYHAVAERGVPLAAPCPVALTLHSATAASYRDLVRRGQLPGPVSRYLGYDPDCQKRRWESYYFRLQHLRPNHTFTVSEFSRSELVRLAGFHANRVSVAPLGLPEQFTRKADVMTGRHARERLGIHPPYVLNVGGFEPHKNLPGLLVAFASVRSHRKDLSLVVVGTGAVPEAITATAVGLGLTPGRDVHFLSDLGKDLVDLYDAAAVFASLSWRESFGVPTLEAMSRGVPVVASAWGASPEVVGDAGVLVDPRSPDQAAAAILRLLESKSRMEYSSRGRSRVEPFSWARTAGLTAAVYRRLIGSGFGARG